MGSKTRGQKVDVSISRLSKRGNGIGEFLRPSDGAECTIEIPFTVPGDKLQALIGRRRGGNYSGKLEVMTEESPDRVVPVCSHFGHCGGCRFQQISYPLQLERKEKQVLDLFSSLMTEQTRVEPILPSPFVWRYRNKMELSFSEDKEGVKYLGLVIDSSRGKVFNLTECHLCNPWFQEAIIAVRHWWENENYSAYHLFKQTGTLRTLTLREGIQTGDRMVILNVSGNPDYALKRESIDRFLEALKPFIPPNGNLSVFLKITQVKKGMETQHYEMHLAGPDHILEKMEIDGKVFTFKISPAAFFQPNTLGAMQLFAKAFQLVKIPEATIFDLYCGTGVLGIIASGYAKEVIGIEFCPEAVLDARENCKLNGVENARFIGGKVEDKLSTLTQKPDLVMVDPPRAGLDAKALEQLIKIKSPKILYISCNPVSQKEDVEKLVQAGYKLEAIAPVDQFPHTVHIENIAVLSL